MLPGGAGSASRALVPTALPGFFVCSVEAHGEGGVRPKFAPSTYGHDSRRTVHPRAILCTCNREWDSPAVRAPPLYGLALYARGQFRRPSIPSTEAGHSQEGSFSAAGYEPPKFRWGISFQNGNQRWLMLRAGTYRVQLPRHAGPDFQAREVLTQTRKLITYVGFGTYRMGDTSPTAAKRAWTVSYASWLTPRRPAMIEWRCPSAHCFHCS
jgi:hypothetical protein